MTLGRGEHCCLLRCWSTRARRAAPACLWGHCCGHRLRPYLAGASLWPGWWEVQYSKVNNLERSGCVITYQGFIQALTTARARDLPDIFHHLPPRCGVRSSDAELRAHPHTHIVDNRETRDRGTAESPRDASESWRVHRSNA